MKRQSAAAILLALLSGIDLVSASKIAYDCLAGEPEVLSRESVPSGLKGVHVILVGCDEKQFPTMVIWKAEDVALIRTQASLP